MATPEEVRAWAISLELIPSGAHMPQYSDASSILSLALVFGMDSEQVRGAMKEYNRAWLPHREG